MRKKRVIVAAAVLIAGLRPVPAPGQTPQTPQTTPVLTMKQAEDLALRNHPQVRSAQFMALASNQVVREQFANAALQYQVGLLR